MTEAGHRAQDVFSRKPVAGDRRPLRNSFASIRPWSLASHCILCADESLAEELAQEVFLDFYNHLEICSRRPMPSSGCGEWRHGDVSIMSGGEGGSRASRWTTLRNCQPIRSTPTRFCGNVTKLTASLPEKARMMVVLSYQEDLAPAEIAETMDIPLIA